MMPRITPEMVGAASATMCATIDTLPRIFPLPSGDYVTITEEPRAQDVDGGWA